MNIHRVFLSLWCFSACEGFLHMSCCINVNMVMLPVRRLLDFHSPQGLPGTPLYVSLGVWVGLFSQDKWLDVNFPKVPPLIRETFPRTGMPGVRQNACYSLKQDLRSTVDLRASSEHPQTSSPPLSKNSPSTLSVLAPISRMSKGPATTV